MNKFDVGESTLFVFEVLRVKVKPGIADEWSIDFSKTNIHSMGLAGCFTGLIRGRCLQGNLLNK